MFFFCSNEIDINCYVNDLIMGEKQISPMISNNITVNEIYQLFTYRVKNTFVLQGISLYYLFSVRSKMQQNETTRKQSSYRVNLDAKNSYTTISSSTFSQP
jgi:hypothetical protein